MVAKDIKPYFSSVIVELVNTEAAHDELLLKEQSDEDDISVRFGKVISIGPEVHTAEQCSTLTVGDIAVFTEFAGYYVVTDNSKSLVKVLRGFDIIGIIKDNIEMETLTPTSNRLVIEIKDIVSDDLILTDNDPRKSALMYGTIVQVGPEIKDKTLQVGGRVGFPPYAGTTVRHYESDDKRELRVILDLDILFAV